MLDGGEIARFLHLATRSRLVSTRKDASVIPPWNEVVSVSPKRASGKVVVRLGFWEALLKWWCIHTNEAAQQDTQERDSGLSVAQARRP